MGLLELKNSGGEEMDQIKRCNRAWRDYTTAFKAHWDQYQKIWADELELQEIRACLYRIKKLIWQECTAWGTNTLRLKWREFESSLPGYVTWMYCLDQIMAANKRESSVV